jgi:glucan phosphoethanolaminetransferase (alkaline phosphatase superfamily)
MDWAQKDAVARKLTQPRIPKYRNIILFIVDALRADHLSIYGYNRPVDPFLSSLMASGRAERVQTAFSNGTESLGGILSTLTSKNVRDISPLNYTLPDLLFENGFRTTLFLSGGHDWYGLKKAEAHSPSLIRDGYDNPGPNGSADDKLLLENAESLPPDDGGRHFFYFHLMSVHQAGYFDEKYRKYAPSQNFIRFEFDPGYNHSPRDDGEFVNMYDDRILQADDIIRQVMECLKKKGYLNNSLGVVTADHGQLLGEHGKLGHGPNPYYGDLRIPMIFFSSAPLPALGGKDFGLQMDLSPTLVDLAGLEIPFSWQGHSLLTQRPPGWSVHRAGVIRPRCEGAVVYHSAHSLLKYSRSLTPGEDPDEMFFDLKKDPQEKSNLIYSLSAPRLQEIRRIADKLLQP